MLMASTCHLVIAIYIFCNVVPFYNVKESSGFLPKDEYQWKKNSLIPKTFQTFNQDAIQSNSQFYSNTRDLINFVRQHETILVK